MAPTMPNNGYAALILELAGIIGWQGRWYPPIKQERIGKAVNLLTQAGEIIEQLEKEEPIDPPVDTGL